MVGHVKYGFGIADSLIGNGQGGIFQTVSHTNVGIPREALIPVGAVEEKGYGIFCDLLCLPQSGVEEIRAAVEGMGAKKAGNFVSLAVDGEPGVFDPVGVSANGGTHAGEAVGIAADIVKTKYNVLGCAVPVRHPQLDQGCAEVADLGGDAAVGNGI